MNFIYTVFGWPLGWIMYACYLIVKNYGLALILFTLITKVLQLPLAIKQQKSMMKTAIFKPQMDALQRKYKNNKEKCVYFRTRIILCCSSCFFFI